MTLNLNKQAKHLCVAAAEAAQCPKSDAESSRQNEGGTLVGFWHGLLSGVLEEHSKPIIVSEFLHKKPFHFTIDNPSHS